MTRTDPFRPERPFQYECMDCGNRVVADHHPVECDECGGTMQDVSVPRE